MIHFSFNYYAMHVKSFDELVDNTVFDNPDDVIVEALGYYRFYRQEVLNKNRTMVVFHDAAQLEAIDDKISNQHHLIEQVSVTLPDCEAGAGFDSRALGDEISRSLILYDHIAEARKAKMKIGVWDAANHKLAVYTQFHASTKPGSPQSPPFSKSNGPLLH